MRVLPYACLAAAVAALGAPPALATGASSCPLDFTATGHADGSVTFHWSGFGGADGYQVFGHAGLANTAGYSPLLSGDARDSTATSLATGDYTFWVVAFHSGTVVASSCERDTHVGPVTSVPFFPTTSAVAIAALGAVGVTTWAVARRR